ADAIHTVHAAARLSRLWGGGTRRSGRWDLAEWRGEARLPPPFRVFGYKPLNLVSFQQIPGFQEEVKPVQDLLDPVRSEGSDLLDQVVLVERINLGHVDDAALRQVRLPSLQKHVSRSIRQMQSRAETTHDHGVDMTSVEDVVLHHDIGMQKARSRSGGPSQVSPVDVTLADHHSPFTMSRCFCFKRRRTSFSSGVGE